MTSATVSKCPATRMTRHESPAPWSGWAPDTLCGDQMRQNPTRQNRLIVAVLLGLMALLQVVILALQHRV